MATYTADVLKSTQMRDPKEASKTLQDLEAGQQAVQRQVLGGPVTGLNRFQRQGMQNQWLSQEAQRRGGAAQQAFATAGQVDEREAGVANQLSSIYDKYKNTQAQAAQQQGQSSALLDQETKESLKGIEQKKAEFDFGLYKNQSQRNDALADLWRKGEAEEAMQTLATNNQLKLQDIDQYFKLMNNKIEQDFEDWKTDEQIAWSKYNRSIESFAGNMGLIWSAVGTVAGAGIGYVIGNAPGAVYGAGVGAGVGSGIGQMRSVS